MPTNPSLGGYLEYIRGAAASKEEKLAAAVTDSKKERRLLNAKLGVLEDLAERLKHRMASMKMIWPTPNLP